MVRMGSPVRFRRGAPPQTSSSAGYVPGLFYASRADSCRLPEICQSDLHTVSRCGPAAGTRSTVPTRCSAASSTQSTLRTMRWGDRFVTLRRSSLGQRLGRLQTMLASRPAIPSIHRLPAPTRIGRERLLELHHPVDYRRVSWAVAETLVSATATLRQTSSCFQPSRCSSRFENSTGTGVDQRLTARRHERSRSRIDLSRARSLRFARFIAPAIAGATMVPKPDGRPRLRSSTIVAPPGVSENL
jgi:hypothetical protein